MSQFKVVPDAAGLLSGRLNYLQGRHQLLNQNLANLETKDYKRQDLVFEGLVENEKQTQSLAQSYTAKTSILTDTSKGGINGNNVNLEKETWTMTDNSVEYMTAIELLRKHYDMVRLTSGEK